MIKHLGLNRAADGLLNNQDKFQQFKDIANRRNYPYKVKKLQERITEEHDFWSKKNPSQKLLDIKKDLTFIQSVQEPTQNKERIDVLMEKYGLK